MMAFFSWLAGTKAGRITVAVGAALAAIFVAVLKVFSAGKQSEKTKQDKATIKHYQDREKVDDEVSKLGDDAARDELRSWSVRQSDNS